MKSYTHHKYKHYMTEPVGPEVIHVVHAVIPVCIRLHMEHFAPTGPLVQTSPSPAPHCMMTVSAIPPQPVKRKSHYNTENRTAALPST